ncbi:MAG TPA: NYN domain-containing protein [Pyrinomonadaceae bacterium]|nr:NYN domain-containing protein [Pyrinomonadaceae bacterium]
MIRTSFLIDGFNLYHSVKTASQDLGLGGSGTRWLDIRSMCQSYLHLIDTTARLSEIYYFSALAKHLENKKPDVTLRHRTYIRCLGDSGIDVELHRFKKSLTFCQKCHQTFNRREEKETDVAIAARLFEIFCLNKCDTVVLITGDTDIVPAVKTAQRIFPKKEIAFLMPYKRHNKELANLAPKHFDISSHIYTKHQFADPYITKKGKSINKPSSW